MSVDKILSRASVFEKLVKLSDEGISDYNYQFVERSRQRASMLPDNTLKGALGKLRIFLLLLDDAPQDVLVNPSIFGINQDLKASVELLQKFNEELVLKYSTEMYKLYFNIVRGTLSLLQDINSSEMVEEDRSESRSRLALSILEEVNTMEFNLDKRGKVSDIYNPTSSIAVDIEPDYYFSKSLIHPNVRVPERGMEPRTKAEQERLKRLSITPVGGDIQFPGSKFETAESLEGQVEDWQDYLDTNLYLEDAYDDLYSMRSNDYIDNVIGKLFKFMDKSKFYQEQSDIENKFNIAEEEFENMENARMKEMLSNILGPGRALVLTDEHINEHVDQISKMLERRFRDNKELKTIPEEDRDRVKRLLKSYREDMVVSNYIKAPRRSKLSMKNRKLYLSKLGNK